MYPAGDRWVTRGGVTDTSGRAEKVAAGMGRHLEALLARVRTDPADGAPCTPCFEYTGPDNRIVLGYRVNALTLLAVRRIQDGRYWRSADVVRAWQAAREQSGGHDGLSVARPMTVRPADGRGGYAQRLAAAVGAWNGTEREGVVVAFEHSGHRVKIKSRQYVALHRARDDYSSESRVLCVWADGHQEELLEQLSEDRRKRLQGYYRAVEDGIRQTARDVAVRTRAIWSVARGDRKQAAAAWSTDTRERMRIRPLGFKAFDAMARDEDPEAAVLEQIRLQVARGAGNRTRIEEKVRPLLGPAAPVWKPPDGNEQE